MTKKENQFIDAFLENVKDENKTEAKKILTNAFKEQEAGAKSGRTSTASKTKKTAKKTTTSSAPSRASGATSAPSKGLDINDLVGGLLGGNDNNSNSGKKEESSGGLDLGDLVGGLLGGDNNSSGKKDDGLDLGDLVGGLLGGDKEESSSSSSGKKDYSFLLQLLPVLLPLLKSDKKDNSGNLLTSLIGGLLS